MIHNRNDFFWAILAALPFPWLILAQNSSFQGDEFSNNLFSDLAPLLALFGERVATQYLRHSTRRLESLIFACAPLGILTAVTSAIRVGGDRSLKAMIGRAEEPDSGAEIELMSSTSSGVCELWNGVGFVRLAGKPDILELVIEEDWELEIKNSNSGDTTGGVDMLEHSYGIHTRKDLKAENGQARDINVEQSTESSLVSIAPNISLNTIGVSIREWEIYLIALCGVILQLAVVVFDAFATYYFLWPKGGAPVAKYAFPLTAIGTLGLVCGMYLCAYIIEISTEELTWNIETSKNVNKTKLPRILWIQKSQTVGDQGFGSYAIYAPFTECASKRLMTSHRREEIDFIARLHGLTIIATALSIGAFILQFVGLRAMHFSASIAQLLATVIMTILRVVMRRHISQVPNKISTNLMNETPTPQSNTRPLGNTAAVDTQRAPFQMPYHKNYTIQELASGFELDIIALQLQQCWRWRILTYVDSPPPQQVLNTGQGNIPPVKASKSLAQKVFGTRIRLSGLLETPWHTDHEIRDYSQMLSDTIADLTNFIWKFGDIPGGLLELDEDSSSQKIISWSLPVETQGPNSGGPCLEEIPLFVQREQIEGQKWKPWKVDESRVEALLHLWIQQLRTDNVEDGNMLWLLCAPNDYRAHMIADWWIGRQSCITKEQKLEDICKEYSIVKSRGPAREHPDKSRIVGFMGAHNDTTGTIARAIIQNTTLIGFTAHYVLYTFLCKLMGSISRINTDTQIEESVGQGTVLLSNKAITELAHKMQERGLVGVTDAYRMAVCALHAGNKLPLASPDLRDPNAPSFFDIYNNALELGLRLKRRDIFHQAQEMCAIEVEWHCSQRRYKEAAILLIKAAQRCETLVRSLAGANRPDQAQENWDTGRLRKIMQRVADDFVSVIPQSVSSSSSINRSANTTPTLSCAPITRSLKQAICSNEIAVVHTLIKNGAVINESLDNSGAYALDCASREHNEDMIILLYLHGASLDRAPMWWALEGGNARGRPEGDCMEIMSLLLELGSDPNIVEPNTGQMPLHLAAKFNFAEVIDWLQTGLKDNISVDARDTKGLTALYHAVSGGHSSMVRSLIGRGADINCVSMTDKISALHLAAIHGNLQVLDVLCDVQIAIDLEARCSKGRSALLYAAQGGHCEFIEALAKRGADMNARDTDTGSTGLHLAAKEGHVGVIKLLLVRGTTLDEQDLDRKTALHHAANEGKALVAYILLSKGARRDLRDRFGQTALDYASYNLETVKQSLGQSIHKASREACETILWLLEGSYMNNIKLHYAARYGDIPTIQKLLAIGVDNEEKDETGTTPLCVAARCGHERVVQMLLDNGAGIDVTAQDGSTPMYFAALAGFERVVGMLLERGAEVEAKGQNGLTPLYIAAKSGNERVVQLLLERGAEIEAKGGDGYTPLCVAAQMGHERVVQLLLQRGANIEVIDQNGFTPLYIAVAYGSERVVQILIEGGAEIEAKDHKGFTPLHAAALCGRERIVQMLLEGGAEIEMNDQTGNTPLYAAASGGHDRVVQMLLERGAEIEVKGQDGLTPLHVAAQNGHADVVQVLLEGGAEFEAKDQNGFTPLYIAAAGGNGGPVQLLLERGAETEAECKQGFTPLYVAAANGHEGAVQLLLEAGAEVEAGLKQGFTPLYIAAINDHGWTVKILLDKGAEVHVKNNDNCTVLHAVTKAQRPDIIRYLLERGVDPLIRDAWGKTASEYARDPYDGYRIRNEVAEVWDSWKAAREEENSTQSGDQEQK